MKYTIRLRSDTAANWTTCNPTLSAGELGLETDTRRLKLGTGSTAWAALAYLPLGTLVAISSSGGIAALTSEQQAQLMAGSLVATTDGKRWLYSGTGSKTAEGSYLLLADSSTEWADIQNRPSTFAPSAHTHTASQVTDFAAAVVAAAPPTTDASLLTQGTLNAARLPTIGVGTVTGLQAALDAKQAAGQYATLVSGQVPASQLPSYVDDVIEGTLATFGTGEAGKIYTDTATKKIYRWSGSAFVEISPSPGSTDSVPEGSTNLYHTTARASAAAPVQSVAGRSGSVTLTKSDVGLSSVDNTSDAAKPVSTATQTALDAKAAASHTHGNLTNSGAIGTTSGKIVVTTTGGALTTAAYALGNQVLLYSGQTSAALTGSLADFLVPIGAQSMGTVDIVDYLGAAQATHTHALSSLTQSSATTGQVVTWNGSAWAAATPSAYTLPTATSSVLGGVKIGSGVTITDGVISVSTAYAASSHTHTASAISDSTAAGRSLLTAADASAQRTSLGLGSLATQSGTFSGSSSGTNTGDQTITLTGDVTGSGTGSFAATLSNTGVTAGTFTSVTVDAKGRVTAGSSPAVAYSSLSGTPSTFAPSSHASSHASGGSDAVSLAASQITSGSLAAARLPVLLEQSLAIGNSGSATTLSLSSASVQTVTLSASCTFTMPTATAGASLTLFLTQGSTYTATFTGVKWSGGTAPTITATANKIDVLVFVSDGTNWYGTALQNF
jgi:hypothetical protein